MKALGRDILFWRKPRADSSCFVGVLPRIRAIRERCDWQPLGSAAASQHGRQRVRTARHRIIYHPVPFDRAFEFRLPLRRTWWLRLAIWLAVLCLGVLACALAAILAS